MGRHSTFVLSAADEESRQTVLSLWTNTMLIKCHQLRILSSARSLQQAIIKLRLETFQPSFELKIQTRKISMATRFGQSLDDVLYAPLEVNKTGMLKVSDLHTVYWEESGNSAGLPVMVLHAGP